MRFRSILGLVVLGLVYTVAVGGADAIQKWRTPSGALYFGDRPPAGSTLLETIADSPHVDAVAPPSIDPTGELARAAAEGRDIIRRREAARIEQSRIDAESEARAEEIEAWEPAYETPLWIISTPPCAPGERCFDGRGRHHHHRDDWHHRRDAWRSTGWQGAGGFQPKFYLPPPRPAPQRPSTGGALLNPGR